MEQKKILGILALFIVVVLGFGMVSAFGNGMMNGNRFSEEEKESMRNAMDNNDYDAWEIY